LRIPQARISRVGATPELPFLFQSTAGADYARLAADETIAEAEHPDTIDLFAGLTGD
jgi:hypothetical protein